MAATPQEAQLALLEAAPDALTPTPTSTLDGTPIAPRLTVQADALTSTSTLTSTEVGRDPLDGFAVRTADGPININLQGTTPAAIAPVMINQAAALFPNVLPSTDLSVRPRVQGASASLSLRDGTGPRSFSFQLSIGPDQQLVALPNGSVAVIDAAAAPAGVAQNLDPTLAPPDAAPNVFTEPSLVNDPDLTAPSPDTAAADTVADATGADGAPTPTNDLAPSDVEPADADADTPALPTAAPVMTATAPTGAAPPTAAQEAAADRAAVDLADSQTQRATLMVLEPQSLVDADGNAHTTTLTVATPDTVTLTVASDTNIAFPAATTLRVSAPSDAIAAAATAAKPARYGLSDGRIAYFSPSDSRLKNGPLNIGFARTVVPYNATARTSDINAAVAWVAQVRHEGLKPFVTLRLPDQKVLDNPQDPNPPRLPTPAAYKAAVRAFMTYPGIKGKVTLWGAVNEPDLHMRHHDPTHISSLARKPALAANYWRQAQALTETNACGGCTVVAGEFDGESWNQQEDYVTKYGAALKKLRHDGKIKALPRVWSLHAYNDLVNSTTDYANPTTTAFAAFVKDYNHPRVWLSEQGVLLQTGGTAMDSDPLAPHPRRTRLYGHPARQRLAALNFLQLSAADPAIDRVYYYSYQSDDPNDANHPFDSALVDFYGKAQPAYCVLAFAQHPKTCTPKKPPTITRPEPTGGPTIDGPMTPGAVLTANPGTWTGGVTEFLYQWERIDLTRDGQKWEEIPGATDATFTPGTDMLGWGVRVKVKPASPDEFWVRSPAGVIHVDGTKPTILLTPGSSRLQVRIFPGGLDTTVHWCQASYGASEPASCPDFSVTPVSGSLESSNLGGYGPFYLCSPFSYWIKAENAAGTVMSERIDVDQYCS